MSDIREMLIRHEGRFTKPYTDTVGKLTIGVGHNLTDNGLPDVIVDNLFEYDLLKATTWVEQHIPVYKTLSTNRQNVLVDMAFNLESRLLGFHIFLTALENGDYDAAADAMIDSKWATQVKGRATELAQMMREG